MSFPNCPAVVPDDVLTKPAMQTIFHRMSPCFSAEFSRGLPPEMLFDSLITLIRAQYDNHLSLQRESNQQTISSLRETHLQQRITAQEAVAERESTYQRELLNMRSAHAAVVYDLQTQLRSKVDEVRDAKSESAQQIQDLKNELHLTKVHATQEIQVYQTQFHDLTDERGRTARALQGYESQVRVLTDERLHSTRELQGYKSQLQDLTNERMHSVRELQVYKSQLQDLTNERLHSARELQVYKTQVQSLKDEIRASNVRSTQQFQDFQGQLKRVEDHHEAEFARLNVIYESGRRLLASQLNNANKMAQDSGARLEGYLLRQPIQLRQQVKGSQSRAATWDKLKSVRGNLFDQKLPVNSATVDTMKRFTAQVPILVETFDFHREHETYPYICDLLATGLNHLGKIASVYDTSNNPYLNGYKPDLTIALPGILEPDSASVCVIVEIKLGSLKSATAPGEIKNFGTSADFGQLLDYLLAVQCAQPGRRTCVGLLSDIDRNYVVNVGIGESGPQVTHHAAESVFAALAYIYDVALGDQSYRPPDLGFSPDLGYMRRRLGNPRHCIVGEFPVPPGVPGTLMAVKRKSTKTREIYFLEEFKADLHRPACIPLIVHNVDDLEFGITPVGIQLEPGMLLNPVQTRKVLSDIISAVAWLHHRRIVHRDIRCENIVLDGAQAVLIDFDCAYDLRWSIPTVYRGGHICIPPSHLDAVIKGGSDPLYSPSVSDDCHAVVLLAYMLLFPNRFADFHASRIWQQGSMEGQMMVTFWKELWESPLWRRYIMVAEAGKVMDLNVMDVFY